VYVTKVRFAGYRVLKYRIGKKYHGVKKSMDVGTSVPKKKYTTVLKRVWMLVSGVLHTVYVVYLPY